jgi:6-phosphogluconolactonase
MSLLTRRAFMASLTVAPSALQAFVLDPPAVRSTLFIGTYTEGGISGSRGIYASRWTPEDGSLADPVLAAATQNPSFLAISPRSKQSRRTLYAVNEIGNFAGTHDGSVTPFGMDERTGELKAGQAVDSGGSGPCHITLDHTGRSLFVANYDSGSAASFLVRDGALSAAVSKFKFSGHGVDPKRQEAPHTHGITVSPGNEYLLVNDLGLDRIMIFHLQAATAKLTPNSVQPYFSAKPGAGPRHGTFHPTGRWFYSLNEMHSTIDQLEWDDHDGTLKWISTTPTLPPEFAVEHNTAAEVVIDGQGRFLYASNRGHDSIAVFAVDDRTGALTLVERHSSGGKAPRHFAIDPSGDWVLVANQETNNIVVFKRDRSSGMLKDTGKLYKVDKPVCLVFA